MLSAVDPMSEDFDPYYRWLGIPPEEQPPHHYRLLGVKPFEEDTEVINNAADRQMNYVRTFQMGKRGPLAEEILNKIAVAKVCLLSSTQKAEYDRRLKSEIGETTTQQAVTKPATSQEPSPPQIPTPPAAPPEAPPQQVSIATSAAARPGSRRVAREKPGKRSWQKTSTLVAVTIIVVLLLLNGGIWIYNQFAKSDEANAEDKTGQPTNTAGTQTPVTAPGEMPPGQNVIETLDLPTAAIAGEWTRDEDDGVAIISDSRVRYAKLHLAEELPASYTLALALRRMSGGEAFTITLPVGSSRCTVVLDAGRNRSSGIELLRGARHNDANNDTTYPHPLLATDANVIVRCLITPQSLQVECNGQAIINWSGEAADLAVPHYWDAPQKDGILLGTSRSSFRIENVVIVRN